jgi:hypothetical protein
MNYRNCDAVRYVDYWDGLTARTPGALFQRFLFAYCSVHTTWESNVKGYQAIRDYHLWLESHQGLRTRLITAGTGLHNNRARWIGEFGAQYWADPKAFTRGARESWSVYRDRLEGRITGLGPAKVSFALELAYPLEAEVLCLDVHMLRLYGENNQSKVTPIKYAVMEADWVGRSRAAGLPPYIIKQIHWDTVQGRPDSRYWSHVFE